MPAQVKDPIGLKAMRFAGRELKSAASHFYDGVKELALNYSLPISPPPFSDLIELYNKGFLGPVGSDQAKRTMKEFAALNSIPIFGREAVGASAGAEKLWAKVVTASRGLPDQSLVYAHSLLAGANDPNVFTDYLTRSGADAHWWQKVLPLLGEFPGIGDALDLFARKLISRGDFESWMKRAGAKPDDWTRSLGAAYDWPDGGLLAEAVRRGHISEDEYRDLLTANGIPVAIFQSADGLLLPFQSGAGDKQVLDVQQLMQETIYYLPSPGDLVSFAVKDVFDPNVANLFRLFDDYPDAVNKWAKMLGMTQPIGVKANVNGVPTDLTPMHLFWGAHWRNLGAGQFFEFLHRVRPDNVAELKKRGFNVEPFTLDLVRLGLKTDDYPPQWRDYLAAVSYRPLEARRIQQGLQFGIFNRGFAEGVWKDRGYHPADAEKMVDVALAQNAYIADAPRRQLLRRQLAESYAEVVAAYETGITTREQARANLELVFFEKPAADLQLKIIDAKMTRLLVDTALKSIRSDWFAGTLTLTDLRAGLLEAGISAERVNHYVTLWTFQRGHKKRAASSGQVLGWVAKGIMTPAVAALRLANLGWVGEDAAVMIAESQAKLAQLQAKGEAAVASSKRKAAAALAKLQREAETLQKQLQTKLKASLPISRQVKFLKDGVIDVPQFRQRLASIGVSPRTVNELVRDTVLKMEADQEKADKAALKASQQAVRHAPVATLKKWLKLGIINADQFRSMAAQVKTPPDDIDRYIQEVSGG